MKQKTISLVSALILAGVVCTPSMAAIKFKRSQVPVAREIALKEYLSDTNEAMQKALLIHNLMNEMPDLKETASSLSYFGKQQKVMEDVLKNLNSCNTKKMGKVFKDPQSAWNKIMTAYEQQRQGSDTSSSVQSLQARAKKTVADWDANRDIMMDVYQNPDKWGATNTDASFPLWKDQRFLYEKEWNQFYENLNKAYGAPKAGRPNVDENTRLNAKQYDKVLAAHKAYINSIGKGKTVSDQIANALPPKAPTPLPQWQNVVRVDGAGKVYPELPEPWKKMSENKFKNYSKDGEMAEFFEGKSFKPTQAALSAKQSDLEKEYDLSLAVDALRQGFISSEESQKEMVQPFVKKMASLGIEIPDFDITNSDHYKQAFEQLKNLKQIKIKEAYEYSKRLDEQDKNNPGLVAQRNKRASDKTARLSGAAQSVSSELNDIIQNGQISPASKQKLVLAALEKDKNATVYLTETNAIQIDQLMRENQSTRKLIKESQQQLNYALEKQKEILPATEECRF